MLELHVPTRWFVLTACSIQNYDKENYLRDIEPVVQRKCIVYSDHMGSMAWFPKQMNGCSESKNRSNKKKGFADFKDME